MFNHLGLKILGVRHGDFFAHAYGGTSGVLAGEAKKSPLLDRDGAEVYNTRHEA